jgi:hypothetical protein
LSVESYGFKFVVDAKDAAKGYGDFQKAVDGVFASLDRFEQHAKKVMDSVTSSSKKGQSDIAKYAAQFKSLASIPIDSRAAPALLKLSDAMARFKAPNTTQITNMRTFFRTLGTLPDVSGATRSIGNIAKLSSAMTGFKAPSAGQAEKLVLFAKALEKVGPGLASLSKVAGVSGIANELASVSIALNKLKIPSASQAANLQNFARALQMMRIGGAGGMAGMLQSLASINGFKAPSAAQTRNLVQFVHAINTLKVPANAGQIADYLQRIANSANMANGSLKNFRGSLNSISWGSFNAGAGKARLEMMGLQNAFSGTFQVGSLLRSMLGSLTIGELGREFFAATQAANQFKATMEVLEQTPMMQASEWERVRADANHFGADLLQFSDNFSKFAVAAHESGMKLGESFKVYEGFQTVMTALHLGQEQQQSVGLAIREIMDQGYVSTQRLTRQLGLVLPGAMSTLQKAWKESGKPGITLFDALKKKMVDGQWALDTLARHYTQVYGPGVKSALEGPIQQWNILKNNIHETMIEIGNDGAKKAFADFIAKLSGGLDPEHMKKFAQAISDGLVKALHKAGQAVDWLKDHWSQIKGPLGETLKLIGEWMVVSASLKISRFIVSPLADTYSILVRVAPKMREFITLMKGMATLEVVTPLTAKGAPALTGGMMAAMNSINTLKLAMKSMSFESTFAAIRTGFTSLITPVSGLGAAIGATALAIGVGLVGAFAAGATAAHDSGIKMASDQYTTAEIIKGYWIEFTGGVSKLFHWLGGEIAAAWNGVIHYTGVTFSFIGKIVSNVLLGIAYGFQTLVMGIADLFVSLAKSVGNTLRDIGSAGNNVLHGNFMAAGKDAFRLMTADGITKGFKDGFANFKGRSFAGYKKDVGAGFASIFDDSMANAGRIGRGSKGQQGTQKPTPKPYSEATPDITDPIYHGNGDSDGKKKKGKDAAAALRTQENAISTLMKDLMEDDPYGKLYSEFVDKLTKEGEILLTNKAFKQFIGNMKTDAATGKVSVDALINALQNGGIKGKVLDDLKKRYGTDVNGIIKMLQSQQAAYENAVKEATVKAIKAQNQATNDVLKRLAEDDPLLKITQDYTDDLENEAMKLLNSGSFKAWFDETENGANGAATATQRLIEALRDGSNLATGLAKGLAARGMSVGGTVIPGLQKSDARKDTNYAEKQKELQVGTLLLQQEQQAYALAGMTDRQQSVANKLLEEFNRLKGLGHIMSQQEITDLQKQIGMWEKQIDLMQQQKEFYENNGIKKYISDIQTAGDFVHNFDNNVLHGLEDTLYNLGTTGKLSFKGLVDGMQSDIIRFASQNLVKSFVNILNPNAANEKNPTMFGFLGKMLGGSSDFTPSNKSLIEESMFTPLNVSVVNGGMSFGGGAFGGGAAGGAGSGDGGLFDMILGGSSPNNSPLLDPNKAGSVPGALGDSLTSSITAVQPAIQNSFMTTFKGLAMSLGPLLGGAIGGAVGGKWGGVIGTVASIGMMFLTKGMGGGAPGGGGMGFPGGLEGGITGSLVNRYNVHPSAFIGAPHYSEGTPNTSGGHAAILHDNEAVIPLSRGRKVPVELTGMSSGANGGVTVNNHFNISSPDADSFRKSRSQIATDLHAAGARSWSRNN